MGSTRRSPSTKRRRPTSPRPSTTWRSQTTGTPRSQPTGTPRSSTTTHTFPSTTASSTSLTSLPATAETGTCPRPPAELQFTQRTGLSVTATTRHGTMRCTATTAVCPASTESAQRPLTSTTRTTTSQFERIIGERERNEIREVLTSRSKIQTCEQREEAHIALVRCSCLICRNDASPLLPACLFVYYLICINY